MTRSMTRIVELEKENEKLKKENERLQKQSNNLWELLVDANPVDVYIIPQLIEWKGESYVKEVFAEDYEDYQEYKDELDDDEEDEQDEDSDDEEEDEQDE